MQKEQRRWGRVSTLRKVSSGRLKGGRNFARKDFCCDRDWYINSTKVRDQRAPQMHEDIGGDYLPPINFKLRSEPVITYDDNKGITEEYENGKTLTFPAEYFDEMDTIMFGNEEVEQEDWRDHPDYQYWMIEEFPANNEIVHA